MSASNSLARWLPSVNRLIFAAVLMPWYVLSGYSRFSGHSYSMGPAINDGWLTAGAYMTYWPGSDDLALLVQNPPGNLAVIWITSLSLIELILPLLVTIGLFSRIAAIGLILHIILRGLMSGGVAAFFAGIFAPAPAEYWPDLALLWIALLLPIAMVGAGPISLDRLFRRNP